MLAFISAHLFLSPFYTRQPFHYKSVLFALLNAAWFRIMSHAKSANWKFMAVLWCHFLNLFQRVSFLTCMHATPRHVLNYFWFRYRWEKRMRICTRSFSMEQHKIHKIKRLNGARRWSIFLLRASVFMAFNPKNVRRRFRCFMRFFASDKIESICSLASGGV